MQEFPDDIIVTVDDDVIYYKEMLSELYKTYLKFPKCIVTGRAHEITLMMMDRLKHMMIGIGAVKSVNSHR